MFTKHYTGDFEDLCLTFSVTSDLLGKIQTIDLITDGSKTPVTRENVIRYTFLLARYYTSTAFASHTNAFVHGFHSIVDKSLIHLFNFSEFMELLAGASTEIDVEDWKKYAEYDGYSSRSRTIRDFWSIVKKDFSDEERRKLLRFVTSVSRPPLMGFKYLQPPFKIRYSEGDQTI